MSNLIYLIKLFLLFGLFCFSLKSIISNIDYYSYCKISEYKRDIFLSRNNSLEYIGLCEDIFKDFSDHKFMKYSFKLIYNIIKPEYMFENISDLSANFIIDKIESDNIGSLKHNLRVFKLINFIFYLCILYLIFIVFPDFIGKIIFFIMNKCCFLLFIFFAVEGFVNFYTNFKINTLSIIENFIQLLPLHMIKYIFTNSAYVIGVIRNYLGI